MIHPPPEPVPPPAPLLPGLPADMRRWGLETVQVLLVAGILYLMTTSLVAQPFRVELRSMEPGIANGDHLLVDRLTPRWDDYARGEIVVFDAPPPHDRDGTPYIKRIVGLPGERVQVENGRVYVTDVGGVTRRLREEYLAPHARTLPQGRSGEIAWTVGAGEYFLLGDNRSDSIDGRTFGPVDRERVRGRAWLRYFPLHAISILGDR